MESSATLGTGEIHYYNADHSLSKLKTYGFIIAIIVGLAIGGAGVAGHFHVGALSNMPQIDAIIMMAAGAVNSMICLAIGIEELVKHYYSPAIPIQNTLPSQANETPATNLLTIFGADEWKKKGVEIAAASIPDIPEEFRKQHNKENLLILMPGYSNYRALSALITKIGCAITIDERDDVTLFFKSHMDQAAPKNPYWILWKKDMGTFMGPISPTLNFKNFNLTPEVAQKQQTEQQIGESEGYLIPTIYEAATSMAVQFLLSGEYPDCPILACEHLISSKGGSYRPTVRSIASSLYISSTAWRSEEHIVCQATKPLVKSSIEIQRILHMKEEPIQPSFY